jgi:dTDP-4-dehydrorhamnose reductase
VFEWDYISRKKDGIDFVNLDSYSHLLNSYDTVINCIADTNTYDPRRENHWDVNFKGVVNLVDFCRERDKKLIHISTDYL